MMATVRLALRMLSRDWRAGELRVLIAALVLAVASVGTVGFFADRVKGALTRQANVLLGADLLVSADRPLPPAFETEARARGLDVTPGIPHGFPSPTLDMFLWPPRRYPDASDADPPGW